MDFCFSLFSFPQPCLKMTQSGPRCFSAASRKFLWWKCPKYCPRNFRVGSSYQSWEQCCEFLEAAVCIYWIQTMYLLNLKGYKYDSLEEISWKQFLMNCQNSLWTHSVVPVSWSSTRAVLVLLPTTFSLFIVENFFSLSNKTPGKLQHPQTCLCLLLLGLGRCGWKHSSHTLRLCKAVDYWDKFRDNCQPSMC